MGSVSERPSTMPQVLRCLRRSSHLAARERLDSGAVSRPVSRLGFRPGAKLLPVAGPDGKMAFKNSDHIYANFNNVAETDIDFPTPLLSALTAS